MTIKSDNWIRRMAETTGMIEPFEPRQIRERDGQTIISYGTSSYGYDIRCAPEFKVFTNIHSTVVDPKNFDEKSFVDFHDDVCIIPPNSFALARTMEYFRIPRNVLTVRHNCPSQAAMRAWAKANGIPLHSATMPLEIANQIVRFAMEPGMLLADLFGGWGTSAVAAELNGCRWIVTERMRAFLHAHQWRMLWAIDQSKQEDAAQQC